MLGKLLGALKGSCGSPVRGRMCFEVKSRQWYPCPLSRLDRHHRLRRELPENQSLFVASTFPSPPLHRQTWADLTYPPPPPSPFTLCIMGLRMPSPRPRRRLGVSVLSLAADFFCRCLRPRTRPRLAISAELSRLQLHQYHWFGERWYILWVKRPWGFCERVGSVWSLIARFLTLPLCRWNRLGYFVTSRTPSSVLVVLIWRLELVTEPLH